MCVDVRECESARVRAFGSARVLECESARVRECESGELEETRKCGSAAIAEMMLSARGGGSRETMSNRSNNPNW